MKWIKARLVELSYALMFLWGAFLVSREAKHVPPSVFNRVVGYVFLMVGAFGLVVLVSGWFLLPLLRRTQRAKAKRIMERTKSFYTSEEYEYRLVDPAEFPQLDLVFYDRARNWFESQGFRFLGDRENVTVTRLAPQRRTFFRTLISSDGAIVGDACHIKIQVTGFPRDIKTISFVTELSDGTFVATSDLPDRTLPVPGYDARRLPPGTAPDDLLRIHRERLKAVFESRPYLTPTHLEKLEDVDWFQRRMQALRAKAARSRGYATAASVEKAMGRPLKSIEQDLAAEVDKLSTLEQQAAREEDQAGPALRS